MTNKERITLINSHTWKFTGKAEQAFNEDTGKYFHCEYCNAELEYRYEMKNELNEKLYVGSECMKKIGWIKTEESKIQMKIIKEAFKAEKVQKDYEKETGIKIGSKIASTGKIKLLIETPARTFSGEKPKPYVIVKGFEMVEDHRPHALNQKTLVIKTTGSNMFYDNFQKYLNENAITND